MSGKGKRGLSLIFLFASLLQGSRPYCQGRNIILVNAMLSSSAAITSKKAAPLRNECARKNLSVLMDIFVSTSD